MVKITEDFIKKGSRNRPAKENPKVYITVHNTGNTSKGANAKAHASYVKSESAMNAPVSWHYTVDDIEIYMHLPENETAYHAGDGSGNGNTKSIGIEICMNSDGNLLKATNNAVDLIADICKRNKINVANIKQHFDWTGKNCPQMLRMGKPYSWETFIANIKIKLGEIKEDGLYRVRKSFDNVTSQQGAFKELKNAKELVDKLNNKVEYYVYDEVGNVVYPK